MPSAYEDDEPPAGVGWRRSAKALLTRADGRVLLLEMTDPVEPALGIWWELPGGGLEAGETAEQACAREVGEETGLHIDVSDVGPALWRRRATFRWLGRRRWQHETVHVVRLRPETAQGASDLTSEEAGSLLSRQWWALGDVQEFSLRCYPGRLGELAPRLLAGEQVDEVFERWS